LLDVDYSDVFGTQKVEIFKDTEIKFVEKAKEFENKIENIEFEIEIDELKLKISKQSNSDVVRIKALTDSFTPEERREIMFFLEFYILSFLAIYPINRTFMFPVERNSIYTFSKELSTHRHEAIDHFQAMMKDHKKNKFELLFTRRTNLYPKSIKDGLRIANDLANIRDKKSDFYEYAEQIENELLHGKLSITEDGEITFNPEQATSQNLEIKMTSSITKTLSSLVVYLKHLAKSSDLIIIDEPEINLHPDNQIILTRILARLIDKGFRLLISTHSDYIMREMNNLIMVASQTDNIKKLAKEMGYKEQEYIKPEDIGVYYFAYNEEKNKNGKNNDIPNKQVAIRDIEITSSGFDIPSIDNTITQQNRNMYALYDQLSEDEENEKES
jgi:predicted ATPase